MESNWEIEANTMLMKSPETDMENKAAKKGWNLSIQIPQCIGNNMSKLETESIEMKFQSRMNFSEELIRKLIER